MTVGFHAPLAPARTGVADYAADLLAALRARGPVEVDARHAQVHLYHLGNNQLHRRIHERALARPGVVVLHDAVLNHFYLGSLGEQEYLDEFVYNYGPWTRELAARLWANRARAGVDPLYFKYPMLRRVVEASRAVVVHNPAAAAMVRAHLPGARVEQVPHLFHPPVVAGPAEVAEFRESLGVPRRALLAGVLGHLRETKRVSTVLRTVAEMHARGTPVFLLLAGEFASPDLERVVQPYLELPCIRRLGYLSEHDFWRAAAALDVAVNLRFPGAGETSGVAIRLMGIGKPVILTAGPETADFPQAACLRVDPGAGEAAMLEAYLEWLWRYPCAGEAIGQRAAAYVAEYHSIDHAASKYWEVLSLFRGVSPKPTF